MPLSLLIRNNIDAEACAYLYTACLTQPMDHDWGQIYLHIATKTYRRWSKGEMPADITVDSISDCQMGEINRLKSWLYRQRVKARQEKDRAERRELATSFISKSGRVFGSA